MSDRVSAKNNRLTQYGIARLKHEEFLKLKSEFDFVKQNGTKFVSNSFILLYISPSPDGERRIGIICGRKFDKRAVVRNRIRRVFKESFRLIKNQVVSSHILFIPRKGAELHKAQDIQHEMIESFQKATLWIKILKAYKEE
jgi:ribonuclease P protein component